jgi:hypothetical protein
VIPWDNRSDFPERKWGASTGVGFQSTLKTLRALFAPRFRSGYKKWADDLAVTGPRERVFEVSGSQKRLRRGSSEELPGGDPKVSGKSYSDFLW